MGRSIAAARRVPRSHAGAIPASGIIEQVTAWADHRSRGERDRARTAAITEAVTDALLRLRTRPHHRDHHHDVHRPAGPDPRAVAAQAPRGYRGVRLGRRSGSRAPHATGRPMPPGSWWRRCVSTTTPAAGSRPPTLPAVRPASQRRMSDGCGSKSWPTMLATSLDRAPVCRAVRPAGVPRADWSFSHEVEVAHMTKAMYLSALMEAYRDLCELGRQPCPRRPTPGVTWIDPPRLNGLAFSARQSGTGTGSHRLPAAQRQGRRR